jgi:hypothetical protein
MNRKACSRKFITAGVILAGAFFFHLQSASSAVAAQDPQPPPPVAVQDPQPPPPVAAQDPQPPPPAAAQDPQPPPPVAAQDPQPPPPVAAEDPQPPPPVAAEDPQPPPPVAAEDPQPPPPVAAEDPQPPSPVAAQDPQPPPPVAAEEPQPSPAKVKKVWTNDALESSRTLMDQYLADKEAREAASAAQAAADAIPSQQHPLWIKMPATVQETRQAIGDTLQDINDQEDAIDRLNKELESAPGEQKAGIQREIDRHTTGVQTSQQEMKALQDHLKQLHSKSPSENSPDSGKLPSE